MISFIRRIQPRRTRFEFWTAGNDIDKENEWIWSGPSREPVAGTYLKFRLSEKDTKFEKNLPLKI